MNLTIWPLVVEKEKEESIIEVTRRGWYFFQSGKLILFKCFHFHCLFFFFFWATGREGRLAVSQHKGLLLGHM
jgi:hypothetical protein